MFYVFQVDAGRMLNVNVDFVMSSVEQLKTKVENAFKIPIDKQVLLVSGGVCLGPEDRLGSFPAGTDTNPIFLFSKDIETPQTLPVASADIGPEPDFHQRVSESTKMPPTYQTVLNRFQLAKCFSEFSQKHFKHCELLVYEQHLQQLGWSAVVANLDDLDAALQRRLEYYVEAFKAFLTQRPSYINLLSHFKEDLEILRKIPVLPALIEKEELIVPEDSNIDVDNEASGGASGGQKEVSLLEWISQRADFMDSLYENCVKGLEQINEVEFKRLTVSVQHARHLVGDTKMKDIKGLSERLTTLDVLMQEMKKLVSDQLNLTEAFHRHTSRTNELRDGSVLPEISTTHVQQLSAMLENYQRIRTITVRCANAKNELCTNLNHRLQWVVHMQNYLNETDNMLVFHYQSLVSLQDQLQILQQVHTAPAKYMSAVVEVVRRRKVTNAYLVWASEMACNTLTIYNDELARRRDFQSQIEGHFVSALFPGIDDMPPTFATQAPSIFDTGLPKLTDGDIDTLRRDVPEMADSLHVPDVSHVVSFFVSKETKDEEGRDGEEGEEKKGDAERTVEEKLIEVVAEAGLASNLDRNILKAIEGEAPQGGTPHGLPHLKDLDRGCESETDTEEFEKVGQSPFDLHFDKAIVTSPRLGTQDASTLTSEDNLQISRSEYGKLSTSFVQLAQLGRHELGRLRAQLTEAKMLLLDERATANETCGRFQSAFGDLLEAFERKEKQTVDMLRSNYDSDVDTLRRGSEEKMSKLDDENATMRTRVSELVRENSELKEEMVAAREEYGREMARMKAAVESCEVEKEASIREVIERLKSEHETMKAHYKLMTMEKSPSENSLEKIDYPIATTSTNHEALLIQMTENFAAEKEVAVSDAVGKESARWQQVLDERVRQLEENFAQERALLAQDVQARVQQDVERQLADQREHIRNLTLESIKHKNTIQQLADDSERVELARRIDVLEEENAELRRELERMRRQAEAEAAMAESVAVCEGAATSDAATSPVRVRKSSDISSSQRMGKLNVESCRPGDLVVVVWDETHQNFVVLQDRSHLFFLNADCMDDLGLRVVDGQPNKHYCYAEVIQKEYCHARKPVNRFRVPQGTKFFRVKARPAPPPRDVPLLQSSQMSQSHTAAAASSSSASASEAAAPAHSSLPSSPTRILWEKSESQEAAIPEEKGEDSAATSEKDEEDEEVERGTELTENFNVENGSQSSIDR